MFLASLALTGTDLSVSGLSLLSLPTLLLDGQWPFLSLLPSLSALEESLIWQRSDREVSR